MTDITGLVADARKVFALGSHGEAFDMLATALTAQSQALSEWKKLAEGFYLFAEHPKFCGTNGPGPGGFGLCNCGLSDLTKKMEEMGD